MKYFKLYIFLVILINISSISLASTMTVTMEDKAAPIAEQCAAQVPVLIFSLNTDTGICVLQGIKVNLTGNCVDADVRRVQIWKVLGDQSEYSQYDSTVSISGDTCGLISIGTDRFVEKTVTINLLKQQTIGTSTSSYYITYDMDPFATVGNTVGAQISNTSYFLLQNPESVDITASLPFTTSLASVGEVKSIVSVSMYDSAKDLMLSAQAGTYQSEEKAGIMRLSLATDKAEAYWTGIQVERTGSSSEAQFPEGRNSDVKYIKIYKDTDFSGTLTAPDECISQPETFDLADNRNKLKMITLATKQRLRPNSQSYFIAYDIGDNARAGNTVGVSIADKNWIEIQLPSDVSQNLIIEPSMQVKTFADCKSSLLTIIPIKLTMASVNIAPLSAKQNARNVPLMKLTMQAERNTVTLSSITLTQTGTVTDTTKPLGKGQGDLMTLAVWTDKTTAQLPYGDGVFDPLNDILVSTINHSTAISPNTNFINGRATLFLGENGLLITSAQPVTLYITVDIERLDLSGLTTEDDVAGITIAKFSDLALIPETAVSGAANVFPLASGQLKVLNEYSVIPMPWAPAPRVKADIGDGYPAMDINGDGTIGQADREYKDNKVFLDWNNDDINDMEDLDYDGTENEIDLDGDGLQEIDIDEDGYLDIDMNYDAIADQILPDVNGDGIPEIDLNADGTIDNLILVRYSNSRVQFYSKWANTPQVKSYMVALTNGPSANAQWLETPEIKYTMKGLALTEIKYTKTIGGTIFLTDVPSFNYDIPVHVESMEGFPTAGQGFIYVGEAQNTEIMEYFNVGTDETGYYFKVKARALYGTNKKTHDSGTTVANARYYCRLKATNQNGLPGPEILYCIYIIDTQAPDAPKDVTVSGGPDNGKYKMSLSWTASDDNIGGVKNAGTIRMYQIQESIGTDPKWRTIANVSRSKLIISNLDRDISKFYYYRIRSQDTAGNWSRWSAVTKAITGMPAEVITQVSNYPNPLDLRKQNAQTNITYVLNQDATVTITLYDLLGQKVYEWYCLAGEMWSGTGKSWIDGKGKGGTAGVNVLIWGGNNQAGKTVDVGAYIAYIKVQSDSRVITTTRKIGVKY